MLGNRLEIGVCQLVIQKMVRFAQKSLSLRLNLLPWRNSAGLVQTEKLMVGRCSIYVSKRGGVGLFVWECMGQDIA